MYILLGGYAPFNETSLPALKRKIKSGSYKFHEEYWAQISDEAKDMIKGLLCVDHRRRLTVDQALKHPWVREIVYLFPTNDPSNLRQF